MGFEFLSHELIILLGQKKKQTLKITNPKKTAAYSSAFCVFFHILYIYTAEHLRKVKHRDSTETDRGLTAVASSTLTWALFCLPLFLLLPQLIPSGAGFPAKFVQRYSLSQLLLLVVMPFVKYVCNLSQTRMAKGAPDAGN